MSDIVKKEKIRNVAIIAHVDHGKTTLVDAFIKQSNTFRDNAEEMTQDRILDTNDLEREKGITISAKNISIEYKGHKINIIDTPGHADFGGEVERTLNMAEGCILLVDAQEGVMPQTRFVLKKAFEIGLKPIVVINKIDKKLADSKRTESKIQDLFLNLATEDSQLDFTTMYAIARDGLVFKELPTDLTNLIGDTSPLLDQIIESIPAPKGDQTAPFQVQISSLDFNPHYGTFIIGKILNGTVKVGETVVAINAKNSEKKIKAKVKMLYVKEGLDYKEVKDASVGEIVAIAGLEGIDIGDTICNPENINPISVIEISPPSLKIRFEANTSPFIGKESKFPNLKQLQQRLEKEAHINVSLKIEKNDDGSYYVSGRGELHLAILIETLRREGYEFQIRKPEVIITEKDGVKYEPVEELYIEVPEEFFSAVSTRLNERKAELLTIEQENGQSKIVYKILAKNLVGLRRILLTETKGNLIMNNNFSELVPVTKDLETTRKGRIVSTEQGKVLAYALNMIQDRGDLFINPADEVYKGMIIGINKYDADIDVNPLKAREKSNVRMSSAEVTDIKLNTPIQLTLEYAIGFLYGDEILEVTPKSLRLRRKYLSKQQEYEAMKRKKK